MQVLRVLGHPVDTITAVTGAPARLVAEATGDPATLRDDLALLAAVDNARAIDSAGPTDDEITAAARLLASRSGSPRYGADGLGWSALVGSEANVEHATRAALSRLGGAWSAADLDEINAARTLLLRHAERAADARS